MPYGPKNKNDFSKLRNEVHLGPYNTEVEAKRAKDTLLNGGMKSASYHQRNDGKFIVHGSNAGFGIFGA